MKSINYANLLDDIKKVVGVDMHFKLMKYD